VQEGVAIKILTNSLASNDVAAVHAGYSKYRRDLLAAGVEIHEYQKFGETPKREDTPSSESSFHSKGMVFDRRTAWIGSFNLDPRSIELNTEVAIIVESSSLAGAIANRLEHDMAPERSWRVQLVPDDDGNGQLEWTGMRDDHEVVLRHEPDTSALKRFGVKLLRLMPGLDSLL
jgi:putative cardiolipin synthase